MSFFAHAPDHWLGRRTKANDVGTAGAKMPRMRATIWYLPLTATLLIWSQVPRHAGPVDLSLLTSQENLTSEAVSSAPFDQRTPCLSEMVMVRPPSVIP